MIRVVIVDDSRIARMRIRRVLEASGDIQVVGEAGDPYEGRDVIGRTRPDVVTLDVEMPRMNGLTFLEKVMKHAPIPIIVVSAVSERGSAVAARALMLGAVAAVSKMRDGERKPLFGLVDAVRAGSRMRALPRASEISTLRPMSSSGSGERPDVRLIAIGSSTGGPQALKSVIARLPYTMPPICLVQHMIPTFLEAFAKQLDDQTSLDVIIGRAGHVLRPGQLVVAPPDTHMGVRGTKDSLTVRVVDAPRRNYHKPSVDVLFESVAKYVGPKALGVIMTGMGDDGARGLLAMRKSGAFTLAQSEETCAISSMPRAAREMGGVAMVRPLDAIAGQLVERAAIQSEMRSAG